MTDKKLEIVFTLAGGNTKIDVRGENMSPVEKIGCLEMLKHYLLVEINKTPSDDTPIGSTTKKPQP